MKQNKKYIMFWIKSSKGTDRKYLHELPLKTTKDFLKDKLEQWADQFGCMHISESFATYGYYEVEPVNRKVLLKKFTKVCKQRNKINETYETLSQCLRY